MTNSTAECAKVCTKDAKIGVLVLANLVVQQKGEFNRRVRQGIAKDAKVGVLVLANLAVQQKGEFNRRVHQGMHKGREGWSIGLSELSGSTER